MVSLLIHEMIVTSNETVLDVHKQRKCNILMSKVTQGQ